MAQDPHAWLSAECKPTASNEAKFVYPPTMYRPFGCVTDSEPDSSPESTPSLPPAIFMVSVSDSDDEDVACESARAEPIVHEDTEMVDETEVVNLGDDDGIKTDEQGIEDINMPQCDGNGKRKLPESWKGKEKDEGTAGGSGSGKGKEADEGTMSGSGKGKEADEGTMSGSGKGKGNDEEADEGTASGSMDFVDLVIAALGVGKTDDGSEDDENEHWFDMIQRRGFTFPKPRWWP